MAMDAIFILPVAVLVFALGAVVVGYWRER